MSNNKTNSEYAYSLKKTLKELGYDVKITHCHEAIARTEGYRSLNHKMGSKEQQAIQELMQSNVENKEQQKKWTPELAKNAFDELLNLETKDIGKGQIYSDLNEFIMDWHFGLHWDEENRKKDVAWVKSNPNYSIVNQKITSISKQEGKDILLTLDSIIEGLLE